MADNTLGRTKKYIEVSGRPGPAEFISTKYSGHLDRYNLTFKIESIPELDEIKLLYRKLMVSGNIFHFLFVDELNKDKFPIVLWYEFSRSMRHISIQENGMILYCIHP